MASDPHRIKNLFVAALELPDLQERQALLDRECAGDAELRQRLDVLLRAHQAPASALNRPLAEFGPNAADPTIGAAAPSESVGTMIGPYKLLEQIGEGGFGVVYIAEQSEPVRRKVALKILKPGMDTRQVVARFEAERQALAVMEHPSISKVFDGGTTPSGRSYFVMELVKGAPITEFCDQHHLTPRQRLELFIPVCHAVQHAHQKGIIHRDLKPSNILVTMHDTTPVPKVIDFGVAKALGQELTDKTLFTGFAQMVGTPLYMSPEQAGQSGLDIDTRSDIYSLGVLLYELLTGTTPFSKDRFQKAAFDEIRRIIREEEPSKPSTKLSTAEGLPTLAADRGTEPAKLTKLVRGELDWIVMKALEKDRNRRYETANGFAMDVQRYLADEPVLACPPSVGYRFRKLVRRNKGAFAATIGAVMVVLLALAGLAVSNVLITHERNEKANALQQAQINEREATEQRQNAEENLKQALAAVDQMLTRVGAETLYSVPGMEPVRRELLKDALRFYQSFLMKTPRDPRIRREVALAYLRMGTIHRDLGQTAESEVDYQKAFALVDALAADGPLDPDFRVKLILGHIGFGTTKRLLGRGQDYGNHIQMAAAIGEELVQAFPNRPDYAAELALANTFLAMELSKSEPARAEKILRRNLTLTSSAWQLRHTYIVLGNLAFNQKRFADAEAAYREAVKLADAAAAERPWDLADQRYRSSTFLGLARAVAASDRLQEANEIFGQSIAIMDKLVADHPEILEWGAIQARTLGEHAQVLEQLDRTVEAEAAYRKSFAISAQLAAKELDVGQYQQSAWVRGRKLGKFLLQRDRFEDAYEVCAQAAPFLEKHPGDVPTRLKLWEEFFRTNLELGRQLAKSNPEKSEAAFRQAAVIRGRLKKEFSADNGHLLQLARSLATAGQALGKEGKSSEAKKFARWVLELLLDTKAMPHGWEAWHVRGLAHASLGQWDRALADQTKALELRPDSLVALWRRGEANFVLKQWDNAVADFSKVLEMNPQSKVSWHYRGQAYANLDQWEKALADLTKAVEFPGVSWLVWRRRGDVHRALKQWEKALADYDKAIGLGATDRNIWVAKAGAHAQLGQAEKAIAALQQAIERGFRDAEQLMHRQDLAALREREGFQKLVTELKKKNK